MKFFKSFLQRFQLNFTNKQMEKEYNLIQGQTNLDNTQVTLYFVIFLLLIPGIPALVHKYYLDAGITAITAFVLILINFLKFISRRYVQFLIALVICSFNFCMFLLPSNSIDSSSKGLMFFRGYAFASIHIGLLTRFATQWQKIVFLIFAYIFRFTLIIILDPASEQVETIIRHIYIDVFIVYTGFWETKKKRQIFKKFYEYREELTKFKELLANYLPQSISIFKDLNEKPLFLNKSFAETFDTTWQEVKFNTCSALSISILKPKLTDLEVDLSSVCEVGSKPFSLNLPNKIMSFENIFEDLNHKNILDKKAVSLSASSSFHENYKSFEVILMKVKWDTEDAIAVILNDITHHEKMIHLRISDSNKDKIIATVSHELRTPLNGILGILDIAKKRIEDMKTLEYLDLCKDNAHLLLSLVNSLLDLHQVREGKLRINPAILEVRKVLEDITKLFVFQCSQKGITLKLHITDKVQKHIYSDENRLKQILINLIGNSLKFTSKGDITVLVDQDPDSNDHLQISVSDTGIGIKEEDKGKLFQMYEKIEHGRSVNKNGVGLGLTIANTLAGILGGKKEERAIEVKSEVNKGSKFSFKILKNLEQSDEPFNSSSDNIFRTSERSGLEENNSQEELRLSKGKQDSPRTIQNIPAKIKSHSFVLRPLSALFIDKGRTPTKPDLFPRSIEYSEVQQSLLSKIEISPKLAQGGKGCILVVDDNPFNILVAENILQNLGYTLESAKNGQEAIDIVQQRGNQDTPFAVILMDCQMPVMDGFETTRILKDMMEKGEISNTPIIALTANNAEEDIKRCYESGMVSYLSKPLLESALNKVLSEVIKQS